MHRYLIAFSVAALMAGSSAQAEAQQASRAPDGFFVSGGFHSYAGWGGGYPGMRVDVGIPLGDLPIKLVVPVTLDGRANHILFTLAPAIQYEYRLEQIDMKGLLSIYGEGGIGFYLYRLRWDNPFTGTEKDLTAGGLLRVVTGVRYYMEKPEGLFFFLNPIGFSAFIRNGGGASYEASLGVGWVF